MAGRPSITPETTRSKPCLDNDGRTALDLAGNDEIKALLRFESITQAVLFVSTRNISTCITMRETGLRDSQLCEEGEMKNEETFVR